MFELNSLWHFVPNPAFEYAAGLFLVYSPPLFEKEGHISFTTLVADIYYPRRVHWAGLWTGLAAYNNPINSL